MVAELSIRELYKNEYLGPRCPDCGDPVDSAGPCEKCKKKRKYLKDLTPNELFGSEKANKPHNDKQNKKVM